MRKRIIIGGCVLSGILLAGVMAYGLRGGAVRVDEYSVSGRPPRIFPDYSSTVIPPNIAPLNFMVQEDGSYYFVRIYCEKGEAIEVSSKSGNILIPTGPWHALLDKNRGGEVRFDVFVRTDKQLDAARHRRQWVRFGTITNRIASEDIDGFLVYRKIHPVNSIYNKIGIYQRNLQNFDESPVLDNHIGNDCFNCHTFCGNHPDKMFIGIRRAANGSTTLLVEDGVVNKIGTNFGYTSWHPSGRLAVYSINKVRLFFHTAGNEARDVIDLDSALAYYLVDSKTVRTSPEISRKDRLETYPAWSADGRYLYFCSAPLLWGSQDKLPPEGYEQLKYDLVRISYDLERDQWGKVETVLSAQDTGQSILLPRISPDGRWLLFCMCNYSCFPVYQQSSDLYLMDLYAAKETGIYKYHRLDINSDKSESWHSWSSNSRWIAFSSKREHGAFTRCYISYVDEMGKAYKPLVLPQKDPLFYDSCLDTFNTPELVIGPIPVTGEKLARVVRGSAGTPMEMPITMATPKAEVESQQEYLPRQE